MNMKTLGAKLSFAYGNQGRKKEALEIAEKSKEAYQRILNLTYHYNKGISKGKWDGMMDHAPRGQSFYKEVKVITPDSLERINPLVPAEKEQVTIIPAGKYSSKNGNGHKFFNIKGLGVEADALTVWPLNMKTYDELNISLAPYVEYSVPVKKGTSTIDIRCLPTFPLYKGLQLRLAASVNNNDIEFFNIRTEAEDRTWRVNLLRGYANGILTYNSTEDKAVTVRIYFPDPGLVVSALNVINTH